MEIITRKEALSVGRKRFFTDKPCIHGHIAQRFVTTGGCVACNAERSKLFARNVKREINSRAAGAFVYSLHPDDHAAALAYCQALDMARGRVPTVPDDLNSTPTPEVISNDVQQRRQKNLDDHAAALAAKLDDRMGDQLRAAGFIK